MKIDQPTLKTARLTLRPYRASDINDIFTYCSDEDVARYVTWFAHKTLADSQAFLDFIDKTTRNELGKIFFTFAIEFEGKVIGSFAFHNVFSHVGQIDYALGRAHWGKGLVTEAPADLVEWAFSTFPQVVRIQSFCMPANVGSSRVMEKIGMQREGLRRKHLMVKGSPVDIVDYAILRD